MVQIVTSKALKRFMSKRLGPRTPISQKARVRKTNKSRISKSNMSHLVSDTNNNISRLTITYIDKNKLT